MKVLSSVAILTAALVSVLIVWALCHRLSGGRRGTARLGGRAPASARHSPGAAYVYEVSMDASPHLRAIWDEFVRTCDCKQSKLEHGDPAAGLCDPMGFQAARSSAPTTDTDDLTTGPDNQPHKWVQRRGKFSRGPNEVTTGIARQLSRLLRGQVQWRGNFMYPPRGFREWHTNVQNPHGWRAYMVHATGGTSHFHYQHPVTHKVHSLPDKHCTLRMFYISDDPVLWHSVTSDDAHRYSLGFILDEPAAQNLLKAATPVS